MIFDFGALGANGGSTCSVNCILGINGEDAFTTGGLTVGAIGYHSAVAGSAAVGGRPPLIVSSNLKIAPRGLESVSAHGHVHTSHPSLRLPARHDDGRMA